LKTVSEKKTLEEVDYDLDKYVAMRIIEEFDIQSKSKAKIDCVLPDGGKHRKN